MKPMSSTSDLTDMLLDDRIQGMSYDRIGKKHGIDPLDARALVREALTRSADEDDWEMRALSLLRLEKVVENLWDGVESGSFKHAEALFKGLDQINTLLALNKQVVEQQQAAISDEQSEIIYAVVKESHRQLFNELSKRLTESKANQALLEEWPSISAEAGTHAIEAILVEEDDDE